MPEKTKKSKAVEKPAQSGTSKKTAGTKSASASSPAKTPAKTPAKAARPARKPAQTTRASQETSKTIQKLATFEIEAPQAQEVCVAGCFNNWDPVANPLERMQGGTWRGTLSIEPGEHQYRFVVDGEWRDDPVNTLRCWNEYGTENCILIIQE